MRHPSVVRAAGLVLAVAGTRACDSPGTTRPFTVIGPTPAPGSRQLTVTDGWTGAPVPQARVTIGARTLIVDAAGRFEVPTSTPCLPATIVATGYLERRVLDVCRFTRDFSLWQATNDAERAALQAFAFGFGRLVGPRQADVEVSLDVVNRDATPGTPLPP
jgi:hypothetical protein